MAVIEVHITCNNGQPTPSVDPVTLSKSKGETINWHNDCNQSISISFGNASPFPPSRNPYEIGAGKQTNSGNIEAGAGTNWSYTITAESGAMADPQVIIQA